MGRRRSKRKPAPKRRADPLDKQFNCPFCNHEKSCEVKMDRVRNTGHISCRVCLEDYQTSITFYRNAKRELNQDIQLSSPQAWSIMHIYWCSPKDQTWDLSEPVDVYSDWIDACESANQ